MGESPQRQHVATIHLALRWGDMDALGHLNNTVYFRFLEEGRISWLNNLQAQPTAAAGFLLASAGCNFRRAVGYPETVAISTFIANIGRSSISLYQEIRSVGEGETLYADSDSRLVWADFARGQAMPMPESFLAHLAAQGVALSYAGPRR
jgi:acyl-CoA thioester hydrolase